MLLRRTATAIVAVGLGLTLTAAPTAAHEGDEEGRPGQNKDVIPLQCAGVGDLTIEVTSASEGRGVGRIVEGGKGVLIPTSAVFEVRNVTKSNAVVITATEELSKGQVAMPSTACTFEFFRGPLSDLALLDPGFAEELSDLGVALSDVVSAGGTVQVLLRGPVAKSQR